MITLMRLRLFILIVSVSIDVPELLRLFLKILWIDDVSIIFIAFNLYDFLN